MNAYSILDKRGYIIGAASLIDVAEYLLALEKKVSAQDVLIRELKGNG